MRVIGISEARTHLSRLVDEAAKGEPFVISSRGKPMVKVEAIEPPEKRRKSRIGFMKGKIKVPDDFNEMGREEIERMFGLRD